jgi:hypothetical protein
MRLLNSHQARAVADAMAALNNVYARACIRIDDQLTVWENDSGVFIAGCQMHERYTDQSEFLRAYSLEG